jgi:hypothetical protein
LNCLLVSKIGRNHPAPYSDAPFDAVLCSNPYRIVPSGTTLSPTLLKRLFANVFAIMNEWSRTILVPYRTACWSIEPGQTVKKETYPFGLVLLKMRKSNPGRPFAYILTPWGLATLTIHEIWRKGQESMSTRCVIARVIGPEQFGDIGGRFHCEDGYPSGVGKQLWKLYHEFFNGDMEAMQSVLLDEHPAGWYSIIRDWSEPIGFSVVGTGEGPQCFCHGEAKLPGHLFNAYLSVRARCEFIYILITNPYDGLDIARLVYQGDDVEWLTAGHVAFTAAEPNWEAFDPVKK